MFFILCSFDYRAVTLFNSNSILNYMEDLLHMSFQLPPYQELNNIYNGKRKAGFSSPDVDYYRLQYLKRYRFSIVKPKEKCECDTCEVSSFYFLFIHVEIE